jgi:hypothetical protein
MNDLGPTLVLMAALGLAAAIFMRLHRRGAAAVPGAAAAAAAGGAPAGAVVPLGQWAVRPDRQWLLLQPGQ